MQFLRYHEALFYIVMHVSHNGTVKHANAFTEPKSLLWWLRYFQERKQCCNSYIFASTVQPEWEEEIGVNHQKLSEVNKAISRCQWLKEKTPCVVFRPCAILNIVRAVL